MQSIYGTLQIYLNDIQEHSLIDKNKEKELAKRARDGDKNAIKELVNSNLRFVIYMAKKYQNTGVSLADLISAGNVGLTKAAMRYDERFDARFLSYAKWWIKRYMNKIIDENKKSFRIPSTRSREVFKVKKTREKIKRKKGSDPTLREIAEKLELSTKKVKENIDLLKKDVSLNQLLDNTEDLEFKDIIPENTGDSLDKYERGCVINEMLEKIDNLDPRSKKIVYYYFGLDKNNSYTLEEIGKLMHISRERVRQLRNKALKEVKENLTRRGIIDPDTIK